jgi:hypothetical protein
MIVEQAVSRGRRIDRATSPATMMQMKKIDIAAIEAARRG